MLAAQLHKVLDAGGYLDQHAFCTFDRLPAEHLVGSDFLVTIAGALAVREHVVVGECLPEPGEHGLAEVIFHDIPVTVLVYVAQQEYAVGEFIEDDFHVLVVEFGEPVFGVELCGEPHLGEECLDGLGEVAP